MKELSKLRKRTLNFIERYNEIYPGKWIPKYEIEKRAMDAGIPNMIDTLNRTLRWLAENNLIDCAKFKPLGGKRIVAHYRVKYEKVDDTVEMLKREFGGYEI